MPTPILYVSQHADIVGGGEVSLLALVKSLDRRRWAPAMVVSEEGAVAKACRGLDIPTYYLPMPSCRWPSQQLWRSVNRLREVAESLKAGILHANGSRAMIYAGLAGRRDHRRVVWHVRVAGSDGMLDRCLSVLAHRIIVNSNAVAARFPYVSTKRLQCIYNGVDLAQFSDAPAAQVAEFRRRLGIPGDAPLAVSVGRLDPIKGYPHLLEAARQLRPRRPDLHWVLVGDGEQRGALQRMVHEQGLESIVHFSGWLPNPQVAMAACDVFVLPSLSEAFGRVLVEAMAFGKPVVAARVGGIPEIVVPGETGILVPPAQPEACAQAVHGLLMNPKLAHMFGETGRQRAKDRFSLTMHVDAISRTYADLLPGS